MKNQFYSRLLDTSSDTGVPIKNVLDFLFELSTGKPVENNILLQKVGVSKNALNLVKKSLSDLLKPASQHTQLNSAGLKLVKGVSATLPKYQSRLLSLDNKNWTEQNIKTFKKVKGKTPKPDRKFDQFTATFETTIDRANLMNYLGDLNGKRVLFIGDDDFTSIAVSLVAKSEKITVLDIDRRILDTISTHSPEIETADYDTRNAPPSKYLQKFDTVFTDPPYTTEGVKLFVSRAVEFLDSSNKTARIYFCYGNSDRAKERFLPIYEIVTQSGLMLRFVFDKFNRYSGAESIGSASALMVAEVTQKTKPIITNTYEKPIYTNN